MAVAQRPGGASTHAAMHTPIDVVSAASVARPASIPTLRAPWTVRIVAIAAAVGAMVWSARNGAMALDADARWNLDGARSVFEGLNSGVARLWGVWPPVPRLLLAPFAVVPDLWRDGTAGAVVGAICFVYAATHLFRLVVELTQRPAAAWVAFLLFVVNLDLLYVQTTAWTEPVFLALLVGAAFHAARWMRSRSFRDLVWAGACTCVATGASFAGWSLLPIAILVVWAWSRRTERRAHATQANVVLFAAVASSGLVLWVFYNLINDPSALLIARSRAVEPSQQLGWLPDPGTSGDLFESLWTYGSAMVRVCGLVLVAVGLIAAVAVCARGPGARSARAVLALLAAPMLGGLVAIVLGVTSVWVPDRAPFVSGNLRAGLVALPFLAVACGLATARWRRIAPLVVAMLTVAIIVPALGTPSTLAEARSGVLADATRVSLVAGYLAEHHTSGRVLIDDAALPGLMLESGLPRDLFVTPGTRAPFERTVRNPDRSIRWIVLHRGDVVDDAVTGHEARFSRFVLVYSSERVRVLRRLGGAGPNDR